MQSQGSVATNTKVNPGGQGREAHRRLGTQQKGLILHCNTVG